MFLLFYTHAVPTTIYNKPTAGRNSQMQTGNIRINGKWWLLKVRENVTENGIAKRKDTYHKLGLVSEYRPSSNGDAPPSIRALAAEKVAPINAGRNEGLSVDSLKSYLEWYLTYLEGGGLGPQGKKLRASSLRANKRDFNTIKNLLPDMPLRSIRAPHINAVFEKLVARDGANLRKTSNYRSIRNFLSGAFKIAVGKGKVEFNPVRDTMVIQGGDSDTHAYTLPEFRKLMQVVKNTDKYHTMRAAFMVAMFTGMRMEEIKGLMWTDYDRRKQVLNIARTVVHHKLVEGTKTKDSAAPMPVVGIVKKELAEHLKRNTGDGFIFHKASSSQSPIIFEDIVKAEIHPACEAAGIKFHGFQAFRRGLATYLHKMGTSELMVGHVLRHSRRSSKSVAGRHYIERDVEAVRKELQKIEAAYAKTK
jgi:integrase